MISRLATGTAVGTALVLSLTGCLGDTGTKGAGGSGGTAGRAGDLTAVQALDRSSQKSGKPDSVAIDATIDGTIADRAVKSHTVGKLRFRPTPAESNTTIARTAGSAGGAGTRTQIVVVDGVLYVNNPALTRVSGGKPWLRISLKDLGNKAGIDFDAAVKQAQQYNPADQTKLFTASKDVHTVGTETVDGVRTTHYAGTLSAKDVEAKFDAKTRERLQQPGTDKVAFDVWVDGDSLLRKLVSKTGPSGRPLNTTILFRDYGKPVTITAPPASEVGEFSGGRVVVPGA